MPNANRPLIDCSISDAVTTALVNDTIDAATRLQWNHVCSCVVAGEMFSRWLYGQHNIDPPMVLLHDGRFMPMTELHKDVRPEEIKMVMASTRDNIAWSLAESATTIGFNKFKVNPKESWNSALEKALIYVREKM